MNPNRLDSVFADSVREELAAIGSKASRLQRRQRRVRVIVVGLIVLGVGAVTTGAALVVSGFPGSTQVTTLGIATTIMRTGTATIDLGPAASGANSVALDVTCVSHSGTIQVPETPSVSQDSTGKVIQPTLPDTVQWDCAKRATAVHIPDGYLAPGSASITITANAGTTWKAVVQYARATALPWAINAHGQSYGQANNEFGQPDLQGAQATNGAIGFIETRQLVAFRGCGYIPVYESDGTTEIGEFSIGMNDDGTSQCESPSPSTAP